MRHPDGRPPREHRHRSRPRYRWLSWRRPPVARRRHPRAARAARTGGARLDHGCDRGAEARGPTWGIFIGDPETLGGETEEETAAIEAARKRGIFVGLLEVENLAHLVAATDHDAETLTALLGQLLRPPAPGHVHVAAVLGDEVAVASAPIPVIFDGDFSFAQIGAGRSPTPKS
jgi:hypothetical protein